MRTRKETAERTTSRDVLLSCFLSCAPGLTLELLFVPAIHIVAHVFNVELFISSWNNKKGVYAIINQLEDAGNQTYLNPIRSQNTVSRLQFILYLVYSPRLLTSPLWFYIVLTVTVVLFHFCVPAFVLSLSAFFLQVFFIFIFVFILFLSLLCFVVLFLFLFVLTLSLI